MKRKFLLHNLLKDFLFCLGISIGLYIFLFYKKNFSMTINGQDYTFLFYFSLCFIITILYFFISSLSFIKKNKTENKREQYLREIPREYSPSMVSVLTNLKLEYAKDVLADLLFLEQKGYVQIEEENHQIILLGKEDSFGTYEGHLVKLLKYIKSKVEITVEEIINVKEHHTFAVSYQEAIYMDLIGLDLLKTSSLFIKGPFLLIIPCALLVFFFFFLCLEGEVDLMNRFGIAFISSLITSLGMGFMIGALSFIFFFINWVMGRSYVRTEKGKEEVILWFSYYDFLKDFSALEERDLQEKALWGYYFAYGLSLGLNTKVIEKFSLHNEEKMIR